MHTIYIRTLKRAEHTVFCVANGQKFYYDPQFGVRVPYSSGQQVKRSILDTLAGELNQAPAPTTFLFDVTKKKEIGEGEVFGTCDPSHFDQLIGGWMKAQKGGKDRTIKRRSPISISAMRALHPLLAGIETENITFDRSDRQTNEVIVRDPDNNILSKEEVLFLIKDKDRSLVRKWIPDNARATGFFVQDMAVDLRRLFCVALNEYEPEITQEIQDSLKAKGWIESENVFGKCLVAPAEYRQKLIPAIATAIVDWRITSNQSRTFSLMETLAISISENANKIAGSIRAKLNPENERKAIPVIEENMDGVDTFVSLAAGSYLITNSGSAQAMENAKNFISDKIQAFDFENQMPA